MAPGEADTLELVTTIPELRSLRRAWRAAGLSVGVVPTMGALHEGHLSLCRRARAENDRVLVTIFVNPLQFGPNEDFTRYPRDLEGDLRLLRGVPVDAVFSPGTEEMYPRPNWASVEVAHVSEGLCGAFRPGHFRGVATVVTKLFHLTEPTRAYFGQKDAQQLAVIRRMVADLNFDLEVVGCPTVREPDGLAMSSRNRYLSAAERKAATCLIRGLRAGERMVAGGERDAAAVRAAITEVIEAEPLARLQYAAVVHPETMAEVRKIHGKVLLAAAAHVGSTRLIDNLEATPPGTA